MRDAILVRVLDDRVGSASLSSPILPDETLKKQKEDSTTKAKHQEEETSLHVVKVDGVIDDFDDRSLLRTAIFRWQILLSPAVDQAHLMESSNFLVEQIQVRRVLRQNHRDLFIHEIFHWQSKVTRVRL
jgi:hypothetical protein